MATQNASDTANREIVVSRLLNAPRELVFSAFTDPEHLNNWWGPRGFSNTFKSIDIREGGSMTYTMHGPDGRDYPNRILFLEIIKPEKIVFRHAADKDTEPVSHESTLTFEEKGDQTLFTIRLLFISPEAKDFVVKEYKADVGGQQTVDRLEEEIARMTQTAFTISREFNAPLDLVWKAHTEEDRLAQWWGPKGFKMIHTKLDLRPGGTFHYGMQMPNGSEMWGKFIYRDIVPKKRLVFVNAFSDKDGNTTRNIWMPNWPLEVLNTWTLTENDGKTTLTISGFPVNCTDEERKAYNEMFGSMQQGFKGTFDQLEEYLAVQQV